MIGNSGWKFKGKLHVIPIIPLIPTALKIPFVLKRIQFPLRSDYSMTVNKSQGCTFNFFGIYLNKAIFSHFHICSYDKSMFY